MKNEPNFKRYMLERIPIVYKDELRIFLVESMRYIPYMQDLSDDILVKIAYNMEPDFIEPGAKLFNSE